MNDQGHADRAAQQMLADRGRFPSGGDVPFDVAVSLVAAALRGQDAAVEALEKILFYTRHDGLCGRIGGYDYCTCGLEAATELAAAVLVDPRP